VVDEKAACGRSRRALPLGVEPLQSPEDSTSKGSLLT